MCTVNRLGARHWGLDTGAGNANHTPSLTPRYTPNKATIKKGHNCHSGQKSIECRSDDNPALASVIRAEHMLYGRQWHGLDRNPVPPMSRIVFSQSVPEARQWIFLFFPQGILFKKTQNLTRTPVPFNPIATKRAHAQALRQQMNRQSVVSKRSNQHNMTHGLFV